MVRLEKGEKDADLDMLASLAEAFGLSMSEFLWPVIAPENAAATERQAREQFLADLAQHWRGVRDRYLTALDDKPLGLGIIQCVNTIVANGSQEQARLVFGMLAAAADQVLPQLGVIDQMTEQAVREALQGEREPRSHP